VGVLLQRPAVRCSRQALSCGVCGGAVQLLALVP